jgi:hypothetical protein
MPIIAWPETQAPLEKVRCIICEEEKRLSDVATGLCDMQGTQQFICNDHFTDARRLVDGIADYMIARRQAWYEHIVNEGGDAYPLY